MIKQTDVGEILQRIYDSEINFQLCTDWDGGFYFILNSERVFEGNRIEDTVAALAQNVSEKYPDSNFAKWWMSKLLS